MFKKIKEFFKGYGDLLLHGQGWSRIAAWVIVVALVGVIGTNIYNSISPQAEKEIPASTFVTQLDANNVAELHISNADGSVNGTFKESLEDGTINFRSSIPEKSEAFNEKYLSSSDVTYDYKKTPAIISFFSSMLPSFFMIIMLGILMIWILGKTTGDASTMLSFGDDEDDGFRCEIPNNTFDDIAGIPEAVEEVSEIVTFLKDPEVYNTVGARCPHGILLEGPPGVGKTALARALAGEAGVNFISTSGSDFVKIYVGQGAKRVRELFAKARKMAPCIVFIDEIDAVGGNRDSGQGMHDEHLQTINALLKEMDGFKKTDSVVVIAATNRAASLDDALVRPGRFDVTVSLDTPAKDGRIAILQLYAQEHPFAELVDFERLAKHTCGFSGAELENVINAAATLAARRAIEEGSTEPKITKEDLDEGISRTMSGPALKSKQMSDEEKKQVAYHEAGHAVIQYLLPECDPVQKISIVSRRIPRVGTALGYVQHYSEDDTYIETAAQMKAELAALMGGRCAEQIYCGIETSGASNDLERASAIAYNMVDTYAFDTTEGSTKSLRVQVRDTKTGQILSSQKRLERIDDEVDNILDKAYSTAKRIILSNKSKIDKIVEVLLDEETIDAERITEIMEETKED